MPPLPQQPHEPLTVDVLAPWHGPILGTARLHWPDEAATAAATQRLASALRRQPAPCSAFLTLEGPMGAGKTTFTRHLLRALGVQGRIKSPTYAVVELYELPNLPVAHFDFYRFDDPREWEEAGFRELFAAPGLKLAEWPQRAEGVLPVPDLRLGIEPQGESAREVQVQALTPVGEVMLGALLPTFPTVPIAPDEASTPSPP